MKFSQTKIGIMILLLGGLLLLLVAFETAGSPWFVRASSLDMQIYISLNGVSQPSLHSTVTAKVKLFDMYGGTKEFGNVVFQKNELNYYQARLTLDPFDENALYAFYIKPDKYYGRLFCKTGQRLSDSCILPQIILNPRNNVLDFRTAEFISGDLPLSDGKSTAYDIAKVLSDIGKSLQTELESDLNDDGVVNQKDYNLVISSIIYNSHDDRIALRYSRRPDNTSTLTPGASGTQTPSPTSGPESSPSVTSASSPTSSPAHSVTPTSVPANTGTPTRTPTATPQPTQPPVNSSTPTATPRPTVSPTPAVQSGTCTGRVSGKVYITYMLGSMCEQLNNEETYYCVSSSADCTPVKCVDGIKEEVRSSIVRCKYSGMASLDESRTQLTCQTAFAAGPCTPPPPEDCNASGGNSCQ